MLSVLLDLFLLQVPNHTFIPESWSLIVGNISGKEEDEMMNI